MQGKTPIKKYSLEDALARALPLSIFEWGISKVITAFSKLDCDSIVGGATSYLWFHEIPSLPNLVVGEVDLDEYLRAYDELVNDPSAIQRYVALLNPLAQKLVGELVGNRSDYSSYDTAKPVIQRLFGLTDHAGLLVSPTNHHDKEELYVRLKALVEGKSDAWENQVPYDPNAVHTEGFDFSKGDGLYFEVGRAQVVDEGVSLGFNGYTQIPTGNPERDRKMLDTLTSLFDAMRSIELVKSFQFCVGDYGCVLPTYHKE